MEKDKLEKHTLANTLRKSFPMFAIASIFSVVFVAIWFFFKHHIYQAFHLQSEGISSRELGSDLIVLMPSIIYSTILGFVLNRCMTQNQRINAAIDTMNALMFLEERDRRTHPLMHGLLLFISLTTTIMFFLFDFSSIRVGCFFIGTFVFLAVMGFMIATELDDPFNGRWKVPEDRIPEKWMSMTVYSIRFGDVPHWDNLEKKEEVKHRTSLEQATLLEGEPVNDTKLDDDYRNGNLGREL